MKIPAKLLTFLLTGSLCFLSGMLPGVAQASGEVSAPVVGEVTFVLGKAWVSHPGTGRERISIGTQISVNDTIETTTNGHVHVRFVDQALGSVRPSSSLEILRYDYDPANPAQSAVKFDLQEGVFRAISGAAAKNARGNFRLNTPIAAIGVRGTDFVISTDSNSLRALVTEGTIVVTRYSSRCLFEAFGACSQDGFELAGGISQMMRLNANTRDPVLLPITALPESMVGVLATSDRVQGEWEEKGAADLYADTVITRAVNQTIAETSAPVPVKPPEFTPDNPVSTLELTAERQLVWGRYAASATNERITAMYDTFDANNVFKGLNGTVGNNHYALFRIENGNQTVQPGLGVLAFSLDKAQAQYTANGMTSLMDVNGGNLSLDFDQNRFATNLYLSHTATGAVELVDSGRLFAGGYFYSRSDTQVVAGAVSLDGKEVGYFFEKVLNSGSIEGLTLWGRQP